MVAGEGEAAEEMPLGWGKGHASPLLHRPWTKNLHGPKGAFCEDELTSVTLGASVDAFEIAVDGAAVNRGPGASMLGGFEIETRWLNLHSCPKRQRPFW